MDISYSGGKGLLFVCFISAMTIAKVSAQRQHLDSLLNSVELLDRLDTTRIVLYNDIAYDYHLIDPDSGMIYADSALRLAVFLRNKALEGEAHSMMGTNYWSLGEDSLALAHYQIALEINESVGNLRRSGILYNNMALIAYNRSDYYRAIAYHESANRIFRELDIAPFLSSSLTNMGVVYLALADYPHAMEVFLDAQLLVENAQSSQYANLETNIGLVNKNIGELAEAETNFQNAITIFQKVGNKYGEANNYSNLANTLQSQGKNEEALELYSKALAINTEIGNKRRIASDYTNLAILYKDQKIYDKALENLESSLCLYREVDDKNNLSLVLKELAHVHIYQSKAGLKPIDFNETKSIIQESIQLAETGGSLSRLEAAWLTLSELHQEAGQFRDAYAAYKKHISYRDSIFNEENRIKLLRLQAKFDYQKRETTLTAGFELDKLNLQNVANREKYIRNLTLGLACMVLSGFYIFYRMTQKRKNLEAERLQAEFKAKVLETELKALRAQMNPHFIFNSLNSIGLFMLKSEPIEADKYLQKFSKLIRMILESSDQAEISLEDEIEILNLYVDLEKLRLDNPVFFTVRLDNAIEAASTMVPPLILQPFIENSIWHGISSADRVGEIVLDIRLDSENLICQIIDNGVGRKAEKDTSTISKKTRSMGMEIIQDRIKIFNSKNSGTSKINLVDLDPGLQVDIVLPLNIRY
ncbi:tetratricopeptide repeat protein [Algoriphagus sp. NG3]|uniref:tetratricopeptide repeat-containing sensor histidine kinase n=1 Tax=unclassified Algoriphagus TaxID=2641541 RepID=UPI002A7FC45B|nr:tetratricopeptide repeat protein [Algoriphagus sp. NG3]WPR76350.1 tetratricopeptide repeat protein [Algoriphagus sp. NG3]